MKCPACGEEMEREDCFDYSKSPSKGTPASFYDCPGCCAQYKWIRHGGLKVIFEGNASVDEEVENYETLFCCGA